MRVSTFRTLVVLIACGIVAAGCDDSATAPQETSLDAPAPLLKAAPENSLLSTTPVPTLGSHTVTVTCSDTGNLYSLQRFDCTARVSGGSGTGYSFTWMGNATEYYDFGGTSKAWYPCQYVPNSYGFGYLSATAVAFDSNGTYSGATYNKQPCDP